MQPDVTDVDFNGSALWITDLKKGKYRAKEAEEKVTESFLDSFTHNIANCVDAQFNNANKVLEADTKELRISIIHDSVAELEKRKQQSFLCSLFRKRSV